MDWKEFCENITKHSGVPAVTVFGWKSLGFVPKKDEYTAEDIQATLAKIPHCTECGKRQPMGVEYCICAKCNATAMTTCQKCGAAVHKYFNRRLVENPICKKCALNQPSVVNAVRAAGKKSWALNHAARSAAVAKTVKSEGHRIKMKALSEKMWERPGMRARIKANLMKTAQLKWETNGRREYLHATRLSLHVFRCRHCDTVYADLTMETVRQPSVNYCPNCREDNTSAPEKLIEEYLKKEGVQFIKHHRPPWLDKKEIDFYIPEKNLGIEVNGVFFHSERCYGKRGRKYHADKTDACESNNVHLIHVWDLEILNKWDIVRDRITSLLGKNRKIVGARKCTLKHITSAETRPFLEENHIQGYTPCGLYCGIFHNENLVGVAAFHKDRTGHHAWELARYATILGCHVAGGMSRAVAWFKKAMPNTPLISYADRRWTYSKGNAYSQFEVIKITSPTYHYAYHNAIYRREKFMLKHLGKNPITAKVYRPGMTEQECCERVPGLFKIWDCGQLLYRLI